MFEAVDVLDLTVISTGLFRYCFEIRRIEPGHRCGEQGDLLVAGGVAEDALDVLLEPHLEHLVGLVENEVLEIGQIQGALFEMVDDTTRGTDDDVCAAAQARQLDSVALATVDRQHVESGDVRGVLAECLGNLKRQLTRGSKHQRLGLLDRRVDPRQDWNCEGCGVLPVPVCARPTTSLPSSSGGMVAA